MEHEESPLPNAERRKFSSTRGNNLVSKVERQTSDKPSYKNIQRASDFLSSRAERLGESAGAAFKSGSGRLRSESYGPSVAKGRERIAETFGSFRDKSRWLTEAQVGEDGALICPKLVRVSEKLLLAAATLGALGTLLLSRRFLGSIEGDPTASEQLVAIASPAVWLLPVLTVLALYIGSIVSLRLRLPLCRVTSMFLAVCGLAGALILTLGVQAIPGVGWVVGRVVGFGGWVLLLSGILGFSAVTMLWVFRPCRQWHSERRRRSAARHEAPHMRMAPRPTVPFPERTTPRYDQND